MTGKTPWDIPGIRQAFDLFVDAFPWIDPADAEDFLPEKGVAPPPGFDVDFVAIRPSPGILITVGMWPPSIGVLPGNETVTFDPGDPVEILGAVSWAANLAMSLPEALKPTFHAFRLDRNEFLPFRDGDREFLRAGDVFLVGPHPAWAGSWRPFKCVRRDEELVVIDVGNPWFRAGPFALREALRGSLGFGSSALDLEDSRASGFPFDLHARGNFFDSLLRLHGDMGRATRWPQKVPS